ncbi:uncharacterized protein LOC114732306 [Neltuma alba]|uniref:uncharacterized protein LOC114724826 n=1 Tax=Neltuma alba TaxID=207710 RepID=UPI0010A4D71B|nr:uncharacterized protein LOC114724826 [Prosopis alba]XP_028775439.1 uncharacterized protein LOC114732306 [Prosopis alba]
MDCKKRSRRRFTEWAFTALGRVLHFLKNHKWKDMNEGAHEQLQTLWDELEMSILDLSWLEPHVKSALNMKQCLEKATKVKRLKQELLILEREISTMKENLAKTEQAFEMTRTILVKEQLGFGFLEKDSNTEIGYGKP